MIDVEAGQNERVMKDGCSCMSQNLSIYLVNVGNGATNGCLQENNSTLWVLQPFVGLFGKRETECVLKGKW